MEGCGAEDLWYETSLNMELMRLTNPPFAGAASDIYKCFDEINRALLYHILKISGMPKGIIDAYMRYQEGLKVYNSMAARLGEQHARPSGIPQGCPLSMMLIALITRPWMQMVEEHNVTPRGLADDLLVIAAGVDHVANLIEATEKTHEFPDLIGAKVATKKSILFATSETARKQLRAHVWKYSNTTIDVLNKFRDLGAHINTIAAAESHVINERL